MATTSNATIAALTLWRLISPAMYSALEVVRGGPALLVLAADCRTLSTRAAVPLIEAVIPLNDCWL